MNHRHAATLVLVCAFATATPALADTLTISGTRQNVNPLAPPGSGRCSPPYFNTVTIGPDNGTSTGTSNLGTFTSAQSHCIVTAPPTPIVNGQFTYTFRGGDSITGTYTGSVDKSGTPGTFNATENLVITGGTGRFVGASGTITDVGPLMFQNGNGVFSGTLTGALTASTASTSGSFATATGAPSAALGDYASAYGAFAIGNGTRSLALGSFAEASAAGATAVGDQTQASGASATALGQLATATAPAASALGHNSVASGIGSTAVGVRANATAAGATAVGRLAVAAAANATALGAGASATYAGSTAIGAGATTSTANELALGGTGSSVRIGDTAASTAAQSGPVSVVTADSNGTLGVNTSILPAIAALQGQQAALFDLVNYNRREARRGIAAAVALAPAPFPSAPGKVSYASNVAVYRDQVAFSASVSYRLRTASPMALSAGVSHSGGTDTAGRVGLSGEF